MKVEYSAEIELITEEQAQAVISILSECAELAEKEIKRMVVASVFEPDKMVHVPTKGYACYVLKRLCTGISERISKAMGAEKDVQP